ncbi:MAG: hypothetical protein HY562_10535 [Ignavibacteriales bacterium]|nr:hypothetical protein [Ignavibacteriales bacterium]
MSFELSDKDIRKLSRILQVDARKSKNCYRFEIDNTQQNRKIALEIYPSIPIGRKKGTLISVYTPASHLQLHFCTGFVVSEMLGEVTFVSEFSGKLSGLTVEKEGGCSLYANVDRDILSGDFTRLGPEVMLSGIALSLTEAVLPDVTSESRRSKSRAPVRGRASKAKA